VHVNDGREYVLMSIAAVGGASDHAALAPVGAVRRPESAEAPGRPDHDGDSDDVAAKAAQVGSRSINLLA
jgi:hypothetical protein